MYYIAIILSKLSYYTLKILGRNASHFPGQVALKIYPNYLKKIKKPKYVIAVTGTDGKTTTANLISDCLKQNNYKVINNHLGSNTIVGIAATFTNSVNIKGKPKYDVIVLEIDEHHTRATLPQINPDYLIVTNIIRDSLKRNAHPEYIYNKVNMCNIPNTIIILNADDLCSSELLANNKRIYYGIEKQKKDLKKSKNIINDYPICPNCGSKLENDYIRYCHIGKHHCPNCNFQSKNPDISIKTINYKQKTITIKYQNKTFDLPIINDSIFNIYNELAVISLLLMMQIDIKKITQILKQTHLVKTRYDITTYQNINIIQMMAKSNNSIPVSLVFDYIASKPTKKILILNLDDLDEKGKVEYIGWIYDTDYEFLNKESIKQIIVTGQRANDHELRLLLAKIPKNKIICMKDELQAIKKINKKDIKEIYILHDMSNYNKSNKVKDEIIKILGGKNENWNIISWIMQFIWRLR